MVRVWVSVRIRFTFMVTYPLVAIWRYQLLNYLLSDRRSDTNTIHLDNSRQEPEAITATDGGALRKSGEPTLEGRYCVGLCNRWTINLFSVNIHDKQDWFFTIFREAIFRYYSRGFSVTMLYIPHPNPSFPLGPDSLLVVPTPRPMFCTWLPHSRFI